MLDLNIVGKLIISRTKHIRNKKEETDKIMLRLEIGIGVITVVAFWGVMFIASYVEIPKMRKKLAEKSNK